MVEDFLTDMIVKGEALWDGQMLSAAQIRDELERGVDELKARPGGDPSVLQSLLRRLDTATIAEDILGRS